MVSSQQPHTVLTGIFAFAPNRATLGGTAYFIVEKDAAGHSANLLIDAPPYTPEVLSFLAQQGGVRWWVITHRGAAGEAKALQTALQCSVVIHEQEAYLLPEVAGVMTFRDRYSLGSSHQVIWTPGYSPGAACVYHQRQGGVLFTGRHLLPDHQGRLRPLRFSKTFHWRRQLDSVRQLQAAFSPETLAFICPGANTGFLRGQRLISEAHTQLQAIDPDQLLTAAAGL